MYVNSKIAPKTLKILINVVISIALIMAISSSIVLSLGLTNVTYAIDSVSLSTHSYEAFSELSVIRLLLRSIVNIDLGYMNSSGEYVANRIVEYEDSIVLRNNELQIDALHLENQNQHETLLGNNYGIQFWFLSGKAIPYFIDQTLPKGLQLISNNIQALLSDPNRNAVLS